MWLLNTDELGVFELLDEHFYNCNFLWFSQYSGVGEGKRLLYHVCEILFVDCLFMSGSDL